MTASAPPPASLWLDRPDTTSSDDPVSDAEVVVVGAGLTGLVTAVLLSRAGTRVLVVEARRPAAVTTGNTTAKISLLQGTRLSTIARRQSADLVARYVEGNREGQAWLTAYCAEHGVDTQQEDALTYAQSQRGLASVRAELATARAAGLDVEWIDSLGDYPGLSIPFRGAVRLAGQFQFDPMPLVDALVAELRRRGGRLVTGRRVRSVSLGGDRVRLRLDETVIEADRCVLATGTPILDRGGFFARLEPARSYCAAFTLPGPPPRPMMLSADSPSRSLRYAVHDGAEVLVVGGAGHVVGRRDHPRRSYTELLDWTRRHFPGAQATHCWSAQDYVPAAGLPYVGPLTPGGERILVATGFAKWGMTNGVAAALLLAKRILGGDLGEWAPAFDSWSAHELSGLAQAVKLNLEVGWHLTAGWVGNTVGRGHRPVCTHLGGVLCFNDAENSWDCPLHGSRFAAAGSASEGAVLEGPATRDLFRGSTAG